MININGKEWNALESHDVKMLVESDVDESFFFEFKSDLTNNAKIVKEVSAFANTFGGYIFIGVSDDKKIEGCIQWNEQRIHTTLYDSISPTPSFDVKRFDCEGKTVFVIRVDEGSEPPYITTDGRIYERISSASMPIKDSAKLAQIYSRRERFLERLEKKVSIPPISEKIINIYGYIDVGFALTSSDITAVYQLLNKLDLKETASKLKGKVKTLKSFNLCRIGNSVVYIHGGLETKTGWLPANAENFLEIMADGSAKMRLLLFNNATNDLSVNMVYVQSLLNIYQDVYTLVLGDLFPDKIIYAKKYEALTVFKQFNPIMLYDQPILESNPELIEENEKMIRAIQEKRNIAGNDIVITDDRIPKTGLYTIDKQQLELWGIDYSAQSIIDELFYSRFSLLGYVPPEAE